MLPVRAPRDRAPLDQLTERRADRLTSRPDEPAQDRAGDVRQRHDPPLRSDLAPPSREMPQREQDPILHALGLMERRLERLRVRPGGGTIEQAGRDLRPRANPVGEVTVQGRQARGSEHLPADLDHLAVVAATDPRSQQIAGPQELCRADLAKREVADDQAIEHQQAQVGVRVRLVDQERRRTRFAPRERRDRGGGGQWPGAWAQEPSELGILVEHPHHLEFWTRPPGARRRGLLTHGVHSHHFAAVRSRTPRPYLSLPESRKSDTRGGVA